MNIAIFSAHDFEVPYLQAANNGKHQLNFFPTRLTEQTCKLADGNECIAIFSSDEVNALVLEKLAQIGVKYIALRSTGYNHVDLTKAKELGFKVARVPDYSPYAIAEHTVAMILALNRKLIIANRRVKDLNFSLNGLVGFDLYNKKIGVIGVGKIGKVLVKILNGFSCEILGYDLVQDEAFTQKYQLTYTNLDRLCTESDIICLQVPLNKQTKYLINKKRIAQMKDGVMLINTSRGAVIQTKEVIEGLKSKKIGYLGIDVYEEENGLFFEDHSADILQDDVIARLMTFKNVLITSHQAFLTTEALEAIAGTTIDNVNCWESGIDCFNEL